MTELTFGVEIELVNFYRDEPIRVSAMAELRNLEEQVTSYGKVHFLRDKNGVDQFLSADLCNNKAEITQKLELDSEGNLLPPWKLLEVYGGAGDVTLEGTALYQAKSLLVENSLHNWKVVEDETLTNDGIDAVELVSPVFHSGDFEEIEQVCGIFSGISSIDETCGLHVHIARTDQSFEYEYLQRLIEAWLKAEPEIIKYPFYQVPLELNGTLTEEADLNSVQSANNLDELSEIVNDAGRDYVLNLWSLRKHGTLEFRGFKSTLDPNIIKQVVGFCEATVRESF